MQHRERSRELLKDVLMTIPLAHLKVIYDHSLEPKFSWANSYILYHYLVAERNKRFSKHQKQKLKLKLRSADTAYLVQKIYLIRSFKEA